VHNHGLVAKLDEGLGQGQAKWAETGAKATDEDESLHGCGLGKLGSYSRERGRKGGDGGVLSTHAGRIQAKRSLEKEFVVDGG